MAEPLQWWFHPHSTPHDFVDGEIGDMTMPKKLEYRVLAAVLAAGIALAPVAISFPAWSDAGHGKEGSTAAKAAKGEGAKPKSSHKPVMVRLKLPKMDSRKGMLIFASKGCVTCHSINGVGGHNSARLDAHSMKPVMNPFEFVAKMWTMAPAMIAAQEEALGEQITFTGAEIANIIAFVHDDAQQHRFTEAMIPPNIKKVMKHTHGGTPAHTKGAGHGGGGMMMGK